MIDYEAIEKSNEKYFIVHDFMISKLNLGGNDLLIYALIYSFSRVGEKFYGSLKEFKNRTQIKTDNTVLKSLKSLIDKKLIIKNEIYKNNVKYCEYTINENTLTELMNSNVTTIGTVETTEGYCKNYRGVLQKLQRGTVKTTDNSKDIIKLNNKIYNNMSDSWETIEEKLNFKIKKVDRDSLNRIQGYWNKCVGEVAVNDRVDKVEIPKNRIDFINSDDFIYIPDTLAAINKYNIDDFKKAISFYCHDFGSPSMDYKEFLNNISSYIEYPTYKDYLEANTVDINDIHYDSFQIEKDIYSDF